MPSKYPIEVGATPKNIAVIGGGASGAVITDALLKEQAFDSITVFEKRAKYGGVWVLDEAPVDHSPDLIINGENDKPLPSPFDSGVTGEVYLPRSQQDRFEETPSYKGMKTNITERLMTYSDVNKWPKSDNFVDGQVVQEYIQTYIESNKEHARLVNNTTVETIDKDSNGKYVLTLRRQIDNQDLWYQESFDSVVVSTGHYSVPYIPEVPGLIELRQRYPDVVKHSKYFRDATPYRNKKVIVVGSRASGLDLLKYVGGVARDLIQSVRTVPDPNRPGRLPNLPNLTVKPEIQEYILEGNDVIVKFIDGSTCKNPDNIIYGTGYNFSYPFLNKLFPGFTNGRILPHLYQHTFNILDPLVNFVGVPIDGVSFRVFEYQAILLARFWAGRITLPPIEQQIAWTQARYKARGSTRAYHTIGLAGVVAFYDELVALGKTDKVVGREFPTLVQSQIDAYMEELEELAIQFGQNGFRELGSGGLSADVLGGGLAFGQNIVGSLGDVVGKTVQAQVSQHHGSRQNHGGWVSGVAALEVQADVSATWLKNSVFSTEVSTGNQTGTTDQSGTNVGQNRTIQVRSHQHVKLAWLGDSLHTGVVDNQVIDLDAAVVLSNILDGLSEQTVTQLHDIGLVNSSNQLSVVLLSEVEGELTNSFRLESGHNLQRLNNTRMSNSFLNATFKDFEEVPVGVYKIPLRPTLFLFKDSTASVTPLESLSNPETSTVSHSMGTFWSAKMVLTESVISLPTPSPGMSVMVNLPPYFLGNTASGEANVANPRIDVCFVSTSSGSSPKCHIVGV